MNFGLSQIERRGKENDRNKKGRKIRHLFRQLDERPDNVFGEFRQLRRAFRQRTLALAASQSAPAFNPNKNSSPKIKAQNNQTKMVQKRKIKKKKR